jgi:uronate dehydrogenase
VDVLVTGASGRIGRTFAGSAPSDLRLVRADLRDEDPDHPHPFLELDVTRPTACRAACRGVDAVVHLAADPSPSADFRSSVLPLNIVGTYNMVEAALEAGVPRFVFASSIQAVEGYPPDYQAREGDPPRPRNDYGVGKAFGEALCAAAAGRGSTTFVAVRIGAYAEERPGPTANLRQRMAWVSPRDTVQVLTLAATAPVDGYVVAHGVSDNAVKRLAVDATRRSLGYRPRDDAFAT